MVWLESATKRPIPENSSQPTIRATQHIFHVSAGESESLYGYWTSPGVNLESHLHTGYSTSEQYIDTDRSADANLKANRRPDGTGAISEESRGLADGSWTAYQLKKLVEHGRETHAREGIPLRICRNPDDPGYGWHAMWGLNTRSNPTKNPWTTAIGKVCPGRKRIIQLKGIVLPAIFGASPTEMEDVFMALSDAQQTDLYNRVVKIDTRLGRAVGAGQASFEGTIAAVLSTVQGLVNKANAQDAAIRSIASALGDTKTAIMAGLAALPIADLHLSDEQMDTLASAVVDDLKEAGVNDVSVDDVLAAMAVKLAAPLQVPSLRVDELEVPALQE